MGWGGAGKVPSTHLAVHLASQTCGLIEKHAICALAVCHEVDFTSSEWMIAWKECVSCLAKMGRVQVAVSCGTVYSVFSP